MIFFFTLSMSFEFLIKPVQLSFQSIIATISNTRTPTPPEVLKLTFSKPLLPKLQPHSFTLTSSTVLYNFRAGKLSILTTKNTSSTNLEPNYQTIQINSYKQPQKERMKSLQNYKNQHYQDIHLTGKDEAAAVE